jgi:antitoxin ParD1/3/4
MYYYSIKAANLRDKAMSRVSISFTPPNNKWIKAQIDSQEYTSKSDVVNDVIRRIRYQESETEAIRRKLIKAEQSGFINLGRSEILAEIKDEARRNGKL